MIFLKERENTGFPYLASGAGQMVNLFALSGFCACLSLPSIMQPNNASLVIQCSKAKCLHLHEALEIMFTASLEISSTPCAYCSRPKPVYLGRQGKIGAGQIWKSRFVPKAWLL